MSVLKELAASGRLISSRAETCPAEANRWIEKWGHNYPHGTVFRVDWAPVMAGDPQPWILSVSRPAQGDQK